MDTNRYRFERYLIDDNQPAIRDLSRAAARFISLPHQPLATLMWFVWPDLSPFFRSTVRRRLPARGLVTASVEILRRFDPLCEDSDLGGTVDASRFVDGFDDMMSYWPADLPFPSTRLTVEEERALMRELLLVGDSPRVNDDKYPLTQNCYEACQSIIVDGGV